MNNQKPTYLVISPGRNEAKFMRQTLDTVVAQTVRPDKWIIVDDGSTDDSPAILKEYEEKHDWIEVITRDNRGHRSVGPGVVDAFYTGLEAIDYKQFDYLCKLDLDLNLPNEYFEELIKRCEENPRVGTCSGKAYMKLDSGVLESEKISDEMSVGASKFLRVRCFDQIGGFVRQVNWDGIDCHTARMYGWVAVSWDDPKLNFIHLRPMGSSDKNIIKGRIRHGFGQHFMGGSIVYSFAAAVYRLHHRPLIIGGLANFWGHLSHLIKRTPQYDNPEFRRFLKKFQWRVLLHGKVKATKITEDEYKHVWIDEN